MVHILARNFVRECYYSRTLWLHQELAIFRSIFGADTENFPYSVAKKIILDLPKLSGSEQSTGNRRTWVWIASAIEDLFFQRIFNLNKKFNTVSGRFWIWLVYLVGTVSSTAMTVLWHLRSSACHRQMAPLPPSVTYRSLFYQQSVTKTAAINSSDPVVLHITYRWRHCEIGGKFKLRLTNADGW